MPAVGVIGSGHTGIAVAKTLVDRGYRPILLDVGESLDPRRQRIVDRLSRQPKFAWSRGEVAEVTRNETVFGKRPKRLAFGSDYVYAASRAVAPIEAREEGPVPTFARGGFSMVWGAAMLPPDDCDVRDWPLRSADLAPYYRQVMRELPVSAVEDPLARRFPLYKSDPDPIALAPVVEAFLGSLTKSRALNRREDVVFGRARLAVRASGGPTGAGCAYCGLCLSGCVYGAIYTAGEELTRLCRAGSVDYRPGHVVLRLDERNGRVEATCETTEGSRTKVLLDRVFVAAGAINTTRLVLESKRLYDRGVVMKTTQGFVVPMIRLRAAPFVWPDMNTLTGVFFEFKVPGVSEHWIHTQINGANELVMRRLGYQPDRGSWRDRLLGSAFRHLLIAMCNFHSDHAGAHVLTLRRGSQDGESVLAIETRPSDAGRRMIEQGGRRLLRLMSRVGVVPLLPFKHGGGEPWGWHFGGTLPMSEAPGGDLETDMLGRPIGWTRVHVVDSSVFPSIPATTVALLAMANAKRIAETVQID